MTGHTEHRSVFGSMVLTVAAIGVFLIAALHVMCAIVGPPAYRYFSGGETMASNAAAGSPGPALLALSLAVIFAVSAAYALSVAGRIRRLPAGRWVVGGVGLIFVLRGLALIRELSESFRAPGAVPFKFLFYSFTALLIGVMYLAGACVGGGTILKAPYHQCCQHRRPAVEPPVVASATASRRWARSGRRAEPGGRYSVFAVEDSLMYTNGFDSMGSVYPIDVEHGGVTYFICAAAGEAQRLSVGWASAERHVVWTRP